MLKNITIQKLLREYLKYFQWFLDKEISSEELDYMLHLRDRLEEAHCDLGDLDNVLRMNAQQVVKHKSIFEKPMTSSWWWSYAEWLKLCKKSHLIQPKRHTNTSKIPSHA